MNATTNKAFVINGLTWNIHQEAVKECELYDGTLETVLPQLLGLIPTFFDADLSNRTLEEIKDIVGGKYGFPMVDLKGGEVDSNLTYNYPSDPALHCWVSCQISPMLQVAIYSHAIVAIIHNGQQYITRID